MMVVFEWPAHGAFHGLLHLNVRMVFEFVLAAWCLFCFGVPSRCIASEYVSKLGLMGGESRLWVSVSAWFGLVDAGGVWAIFWRLGYPCVGVELASNWGPLVGQTGSELCGIDPF